VVQSRTLVRNVIVNFAGQIMPFLAAVVSMPVLAKALGIERLGLLNLAWVVSSLQ
jgi:O-antigen/teichoic acid export membrane protein